MAAGPEQRVGAHVGQHVVHPAHVPLEVEAQAPIRRRARHHGPGRGFLGDHELVGVAAQNGLVELAQKGDGLQVFLAAVAVGLPLAVPAVVIQVQHGGHGVHPQTVDVVLLHPEQRAGHQKRFHLRHTVVEYHGAPFFVFPAAGVRVLVAGRAVKHVQPEPVFWKMRGHPVHNHPNAALVALVHKRHKILGGAVAAGGRKVAGNLVAPAAVEGVFGNGQQLQVGVAHLL